MSNKVTIRRLDGEEAEVAEGALPIYTRRGWVVAEGSHVKAADVLAQVGDDPGKARLALEAERSSDKPRKTLVSALERLVNPHENEEK